MSVLTRADWLARQGAHEERADALTAGRRARAAVGRTHPVEDFLFTYYPAKPAVLRRWHPGAGVVLADAEELAGRRWYARMPGGVAVDAAAFLADRSDGVAHIRALLAATSARAPQLACFGLHEWAMVYRQGEHRHPVPLRLGQAGTDEVVEAHQLRCTHFDAFRFFTPAAAPRNAAPLDREGALGREQPGCLHANMDTYKWALKLGPLVPGELLLDCVELAREIRVLDMRASPYDLAEAGYAPVRIEEPDGKAQYVRAQRGFAERAGALRERLLTTVPD